MINKEAFKENINEKIQEELILEQYFILTLNDKKGISYKNFMIRFLNHDKYEPHRLEVLKIQKKFNDIIDNMK